MNTRQGIAFNSPCFDSESTMSPKFGGRGRAGAWDVSAKLTANVGLE